MIHRVSCGVFGNADELAEQIKVLEKLEDGIANNYTEKAVEGVDKEQILNLMKETTWFTGEEAQKFFKVIVGEKENFINFAFTNQKFKHIPKDILNKIDRKKEDLEAKEKEKMENLSKEIDIALALGGI